MDVHNNKGTAMLDKKAQKKKSTLKETEVE
jgi:hypothetical protein